VAAEFALLASRRSRLEALAAAGDRRADSALAGIRELSLMLAGAQLGITMASLGLGAVAEPALAAGLEQLFGLVGVPAGLRHAIAFTIALSIVVFLHMVVGEMAPKSWAITHPEDSALLLARPFRAFALVVRPFIRLLNMMANALVRLCGVEPQAELAQVHSPADLVMLVEESAEHGAIAADQRLLFARALDLSGLDAESAMIPRADVVAVQGAATVDELERVASSTGRSRLPVYTVDLDHVLGVLHVKDLLTLRQDERSATTAATLARPALVVPESKPLEDVMLAMRQQRQHVALVVDEYGSVSGLVTLEDVLEELIGEFEDESDRAGRPLRRSPGGQMVVPATLRPDELEARTGLRLPEGGYETLAGYVIEVLGRLPDVGDSVVHGRTRLSVVKMDGHRVVDVLLQAVRPDGADEPPAPG